MKKGQKKDHILLPPLLFRQASRGVRPETLNDLPSVKSCWHSLGLILDILGLISVFHLKIQKNRSRSDSPKESSSLGTRPPLLTPQLTATDPISRVHPFRSTFSLPRPIPILIRISPAIFNLAETTKVD